mgnify:CR=1 FL=1
MCVASITKVISTMTTSVQYEIKSISAKEIVEDVWNVMAVLELEVVSGFEHAIKHFLHTTGCFRMLEDGFLVESLHLSKTDEGLTITIPNYVEVEERSAEITISNEKYNISKVVNLFWQLKHSRRRRMLKASSE